MCLIAFAIDADPACPLLIAANRDEFFDRPTAALHRWSQDGALGLWAGRDLRDGGTWLGVSEAGRVALLTNVRCALPQAARRSRGELALRWLQGQQSVDALASALDPSAYAGFNLVVGDLHGGDWAWLGNRDPQDPHATNAPNAPIALHRRQLGPGLYGLSNAVLDTPWPKTQRLKNALGQSLAQDPKHPHAWLHPLTQALADDRPAAAHELPHTGVPADIERRLSSPFVKMPDRGYGTRSSLVLHVQPGPTQRRVDLHEWTHPPQGWSTDRPVRHSFAV